jgi:hypothetical protein
MIGDASPTSLLPESRIVENPVVKTEGFGLPRPFPPGVLRRKLRRVDHVVGEKLADGETSD